MKNNSSVVNSNSNIRLATLLCITSIISRGGGRGGIPDDVVNKERITTVRREYE